MAVPTNADVVVVRGFWIDEATGQGVRAANNSAATITFDPVPLGGATPTITPNLRDTAFSSYVKTRQRVAAVDQATGYFAALLVASNDPDLDAYGGRKVTMLGETPFVIEVPYNASTITVDAATANVTGLEQGSTAKAIWLVDAALVTTPAPTPTNSYLTSAQTLSTIATGIEAHDEDPAAHADIRALLGGGVSEIATKTFTYTAAAGQLVPADTSAGAFTITLPAATAGRTVAVRWEAGTTAPVIAAAGSDKIGASTATTTTPALVGEVLTLQVPAAGGRWRVVSGFKTQSALDARLQTDDLTRTLRGKIASRTAPMVVALAGDSTGDESAEWFRRAWDRWLADRPYVTATYRLWNDGTNAYDAPTTIQTGVAETMTVRALADTFTRSGELKTSQADRSPNPWDGATGLFTLDGTSAVAQGGTGYNVLPGTVVGGDRTLTANITVDTTAGATTKQLLLGLGAGVANRVWLAISVSTGGAITWAIEKFIASTYAQVTAGTGTPLASSSTQTVTATLRLNGAALTGTLNGVTISGTLSGGDVTALASTASAYIDTANTATAGWKVNDLTVDSVVTAQAVQTLDLYNASRAGTVLQYQYDRLATMFPSGTAFDTLFVSSSHNYTTTNATDYLTAVEAFVDAYRTLHPETGIVLSSQNPELPPAAGRDAHRLRQVALRGYARRRGYDYLPAYEAFLAQPNQGSLYVRADGVHPTGVTDAANPNNGQYVWATAALALLNGAPGAFEAAALVDSVESARQPLAVRTPKTGNYFFPVSSAATQNTTIGINTVRVAPWILEAPVTLTKIGVEVTTAGEAGAKVRPLIYGDTGAYYPGGLLVDGGRLTGDATGVVETTASITLPAGIYWVGGVGQVATTTSATMRSLANWHPPYPLALGTSAPTAGLTAVSYLISGTVTDTPPSTFPSNAATSGTAARVFLKAV